MDAPESPEGPAGPDGAPEPRPGSAALAWRGVKYFAYGLGSLLLTAVLLVGVALLLLQTEWGTRVAKNLILAQVNPIGEARLEIDEVDGNWLTHLELKGVRLVRPPLPSDDVPAADAARDSVRMLQIDSLKTDFRLLGLLDNRVQLDGVQAYGPDLRMAQQADGSWDLLQPFVSDTTQDATESAWRVRLDSVEINRGRLDMKFYTASGADSTLRVRDLNAFAYDMDFGGPGTPRISVRNLSARFTPPGQTLERQFAFRGKLDERELTVDRLTLDSPYSNVSGEGTLVLPGEEGGPVRNIDFRLEGQPLSFRDLAGFVPGIDASRSVRFTLSAEGTSERLQTTLDATFDDGGTVQLGGAVAPGLGGKPLVYELEGRVRQLDPGFFTPGPEQGRINANFSTELSGTSVQELDGTLRAELFNTRFGEYVVQDATLAAHFDDGTAVLDAQGALRGASFAVSGTVRPFGDPLAYDLSGRFQNVDLGRFTDNADQQSDLDGRISLQGYGTSLADANVTAQLALADSRINRFTVNEGRFTVRLIDGKMNLSAHVRSPQGIAEVAGNVWLTADPLRYRIHEGYIENLDVAALAGDTTRSSFTGTFRLQGQGTNPQQNLRLDVADLQLRNSYYGPYVINSTNLDAVLAGGRLDLDGQADLQGGTFTLSDATIYPFQPVPSYSVGSASFQNVNIGQLGQYPGGDIEQSSDLSGTVSLEGHGFDPQTMFLTGTARLSDSRLNRQQINSAVVELTLQNGLLTYDGTLDVPQGQTHIAGTIRPFAEDPSFQIDEGTFAGIDVGALAGIEGLETNLQGEILAFEGTGFSLEEFQGRVRVDLTGSEINDATVTGGTLDLEAEEGVIDLVADLEFASGGTTDLDVRLDRAEPLSYRATGTVDSLDVGRLLGEPEAGGLLSLRLDVQGEGTDLRTAVSSGTIDVGTARFEDIYVRSLVLDYTLREGLLVVDTLALRSNVADATGEGILSLYDPETRYPTNFHFTASVDNLAPVRPFVSDSLRALAIGENAFQGRLVGDPGGPLRLESDVRLESLVYNDLRLSNFDGTVSATTAVARDSTGAGGLLVALREASIETLDNARVQGEVGYLATDAFSTREARFDAIYNGDQIDLEAYVRVDRERDVELAGVLDPRPDRQRLRLDTLNVRFGTDYWKLLQDATITYGEEYRVSGLLLYTEDGQQIAMDGVIDFDGLQNFVVTLEDFRIGAVADLLKYEDLGGTVSGALSLSGPAQSPELTGTLSADLESAGRDAGTLQMALDYANERLGLDATLMHEDQSALTAEGYLPLDLRLTRPEALTSDVLAPDAQPADTVAIGEEDSPVDIIEVSADTLGTGDVALAVQADSFAVEWIRPFLDPEQVEEIGGRITADMTVGGTLAAPRLEGTASLTDGTLELAALGTTYRNIRAHARLTGDRVLLREAVMVSGDGRLTARGTIELQALTLGQLDLAIRAEDFRVVATEGYRATASADLQLTGTTAAPVLRGDVSVRDADVYLDAFAAGGEYGEVEFSEEDLRELREHFGVRITEADTTRSRVYQALAMDLDVEIERDTWLRSIANPELDVQLEGDVDLEKEAGQDLQLFGTIEVVPERSRVVQFSRRFDITNGVITFNGAPSEPSIDFEAEYSVEAYRSRGSEVVITLSVDGRPGDLQFELGSSPSMETTDILSYIATGRPASESFVGGGSGGLERMGLGVALGQVTNLIEGLAGEQGLGLDIIEIEQDPQRGTVLTAGEYIYIESVPNPLFVAVSQPLTSTDAGVGEEEDQTEVTLEYEVTEGLLVRLLRRESIRLNLRFEYAY